jgi:hypothetical protein
MQRQRIRGKELLRVYNILHIAEMMNGELNNPVSTHVHFLEYFMGLDYLQVLVFEPSIIISRSLPIPKVTEAETAQDCSAMEARGA